MQSTPCFFPKPEPFFGRLGRECVRAVEGLGESKILDCDAGLHRSENVEVAAGASRACSQTTLVSVALRGFPANAFGKASLMRLTPLPFGERESKIRQSSSKQRRSGCFASCGALAPFASRLTTRELRSRPQRSKVVGAVASLGASPAPHFRAAVTVG